MRDKIKDRLISCPDDWKAIAADAKVTKRWIEYFAGDHIENPGIVTLDRVAKTLRIK